MPIHVSLIHFLFVSAILFSFGVYAVITRRNAIMVLMGIELILNSANINFIAFGAVRRDEPGRTNGVDLRDYSRSVRGRRGAGNRSEHLPAVQHSECRRSGFNERVNAICVRLMLHYKIYL